MRSLALTATLALLSLAPCAAGAASPRDPDFEPERPLRSIALGPVPSGHLTGVADVGWLQSGLEAQVGLIASADLFVRVESMLLYDGIDAQTGLYAGLRLTPINGSFRLTAEGFYGQLLSPLTGASSGVEAYGGGLSTGIVLRPVTLYARVRIRGLHSSASAYRQTLRDSEAGAGVERALGPVLLGAEAFVWGRPNHAGMLQWRLRVALPF